MADDGRPGRPARPAQHEEQGDEVEAHKLAANPEESDEAEGDDDVEAHGHGRVAGPRSA